MNRERMEEGLRTFLAGLRADDPEFRALSPADRERELAEGARRVARAFADDLLAGYAEDPSAHLAPIEIAGGSGPVVLRQVRFVSVCAHHLLPYRGEAHVGFLPGAHHVGIGSIARLVDTLARRLTLQERLTAAIADELDRALRPRGAIVVLEAEHLCLSVRGAKKTGHRLVTVERRGEIREDLERLVLP